MYKKDIIEKISSILIPLGKDSPSNGTSTTASAVLIGFIFSEDEWQIIFTRRSEFVREHKGQVSFPGGAYEEGDGDLIKTALRETNEEIGISQEKINIIGKLESFKTITGFEIWPYVGIIEKPAEYKLNSDEVSRVFTVPVNWLMKSENWEIKPYEYRNEFHDVIYFKPYQDEIIWGITAKILTSFFNKIQE